jgi:hypothetical protein
MPELYSLACPKFKFADMLGPNLRFYQARSFAGSVF